MLLQRLYSTVYMEILGKLFHFDWLHYVFSYFTWLVSFLLISFVFLRTECHFLSCWSSYVTARRQWLSVPHFLSSVHFLLWFVFRFLSFMPPLPLYLFVDLLSFSGILLSLGLKIYWILSSLMLIFLQTQWLKGVSRD